MSLITRRQRVQQKFFPLSASSNGRYLVQPNGAPFFPMGDGTAQTLCQLVPADVDYYLRTRASQGFTSIWMHAVTNSGNGANVTANAATRDAIQPFTGVLSGLITDPVPNYDFTTPNPVYFARLDQIIQIAEKYGILVNLGVFDNDSFLSVMQANGNSKMFTWGAFLGARYASFPNVVYLIGNDFQTWSTVPSDTTLAQNVMAGIASSDHNKFQTTELSFNMSGSHDDATLLAYCGTASAYTYYPSYFQILKEYNGTGPIPVYLVETYYEGTNFGNLTPNIATDLMLRKIAYWTTLSGGLAGYLYGSKWYDFGTGWQAGLFTTAVSHLGIWKKFFTSQAFHQLVPDQTNVVVTSGFGTATGNNTGNIQTDSFVTAAAAADGSLAVVYVPTNTSPVVDMTKMRGSTVGRWMDPTTGIFVAASGSPFSNSGSHTFTNPGNNALGDPDQVLVLTA